MEAYNAGQKVFGENRAQEMSAKKNSLPEDIEWHFIGSLQTNKVKEIAPFVHTIQSVDSLKLLEEIDRQAYRCGRIINIMLEVHIAKEDTKHGLTVPQCNSLAEIIAAGQLPNIRLCGLMGMATFTDDKAMVSGEFRSLHSLFSALKANSLRDCSSFSALSMGMTDDYELAVAEGSTMIRIGSLIFGPRS
jgi:pyridoxal phosphate enzyme (YggS family)